MNYFISKTISLKNALSLFMMVGFSMAVFAQQYGNPYIKHRLTDQQRAVKSTAAQKNYHLGPLHREESYYQDRYHREQVRDYYRWLAERDYYYDKFRHPYDARRDQDRRYYDRRYHDRNYPYRDDPYYDRRRGARVSIAIDIPLEETVRRQYHTSTYINTSISTDRSKAWFIYSTRGLPLMNSLSDRQRVIHYNSLERALHAPKIGKAVEWSSRYASGSVVAINEGHNRDGDYCRQFKQLVNYKKNRDETLTTACRRHNGHWKIVVPQ